MPVAPLSSFCKGNSMLLEEDEKPSVHTEREKCLLYACCTSQFFLHRKLNVTGRR